jgi:hypothetical protein
VERRMNNPVALMGRSIERVADGLSPHGAVPGGARGNPLLWPTCFGR